MKRRLRIASVCRELPNPSDPSIGIFVQRRLQAMAELSDVDVIQPVASFPGLKPVPSWARGTRSVGSLQIHPEPMFYIPKYLKSLDGRWLARSVAAGLRRLEDCGAIDLLDAHFGYPEGVGTLFASRQFDLPVFVTFRGFEAEFIQRPVIGEQIVSLLKQVDGCICVSHSLKEIALANGADPERTTVIHNAIDSSLFHHRDRDASRQRLGLGLEIPLVVSVGHLISRKRHHVVLRGFADVVGKYPQARLVIVGAETFEPQYPAMLRSLVSELGLQDSVVFVGNLAPPEVAEWLAAADVFALGTQREGCCNAVLESLASGLPVVTTPVGDNAWFVRDGENGYIVPVDDSGAMSAAISHSLEREWDREGISGALSVGGWDRVAKQVLAFFVDRLIARQASP